MNNVLAERIRELAEKHGSYRAAARVLGITHEYLHRLEAGDKTNPSDETLRKLGLRRIIYLRTEGSPMSQSDMPWTDEQFNPATVGGEEYVYADFARQLERELAAAQQALGTWRRLYADMEERYEQARAARERAEKRIAAALAEIEEREDADHNGEHLVPNDWMRVGMILRWEGPV